MTTAIEVRALCRSYGQAIALNDLNFTVERGELFGLVGPDGAGKTTVLRILAGVLRPTSGEAVVDGHSVVSDPEEVKDSIAYMSQRFGLYADLTVRENIDFYADLYGVPRSERPHRLERLYAFSRLGPFEHRLAGKLSGGMKQKLSLCCALVHRPGILLLDEPTLGVDTISRRDLWLLLHQMVAEGVTVVVSTAYLDEAERCYRVALLHGGRLLALDSPEVLQAGFPGELLEVQASDLRAAAAILKTLPSVRQAALFGDRIHVSVERASRDWPPAAAALVAAGVGDAQARPRRASLEDVFIARLAEAAA